ncbi:MULTISPECIES: hypothetical protein [unclassified Burkholderia]|uniref:hypothetical protein n=1 Tax=unclassified Burkholderia TaxID=2613784 RepID=UPI00211D91B0|nr:MULTISPECIES: hypothetical protein [unclassified Burkholderia]
MMPFQCVSSMTVPHCLQAGQSILSGQAAKVRMLPCRHRKKESGIPRTARETLLVVSRAPFAPVATARDGRLP